LEQVRPFNFILSFQVDPLAEEMWLTELSFLTRPVAPFDKDVKKAARKSFDRKTGKSIKINQLQAYSDALAQYHLFAEAKFLNARYLNRGEIRRRHVKIEFTDIQYKGKESANLEGLILLENDHDAQPDYGMESGAYEKLLAEAKRTIENYGVPKVGKVARISNRYLREIRDGAPNVSPDLLKRLESAIPALQVAQTEQEAQHRRIMEWLKTQCDVVGLRKFERTLDIDPANLGKKLLGQRKLSRGVRHAFDGDAASD
jgi:hypothetical protein